MESKKRPGRPKGSLNKKTLAKMKTEGVKPTPTPVIDEDKQLEEWILNNRTKLINPKQLTPKEEIYLVNNYNRIYNTNKKRGCGNCLHEILYVFKRSYFKDL